MAYIAPEGLLIFRPSSNYIPPPDDIIFYPGSDLVNAPEVSIIIDFECALFLEVVPITESEIVIEASCEGTTTRTDILIPLISVPFRVSVNPLDTILASEDLEVKLLLKFGIKTKFKCPVYNNIVYRIKLT